MMNPKNIKSCLNVYSLPAIVIIFGLLIPAYAFADKPAGDKLAMSSLLKKGLAELIELEVALATGTLKPLKLAPSVASVITAEDIEIMGATTLDEVLETVPGLHVQPSTTNIFSPTYSFRGIYTQLNPQILLLVDGLPLKINSNGVKPYRLRMPVSMISRIEIIRGPGSAVLGADAFAGAINIITKSTEEISGTNIGLWGGSFNSYDLWAQHGGSYKGTDIVLGLEYTKGDGDKKRIIEKDALGSGAPSLAPGPLDTHYETLNANLSVHRDRFRLKLNSISIPHNGVGAGISNVLNNGLSNTYQYFLLGSLSYHEDNFLKDFDLTATISGRYVYLENTFYFFPENYRRMIGMPGVREIVGDIELSGNYHGFADHQVRLSLGAGSYDINPFQHKNYGPGITEQFGQVVDITDTPYVYMTHKHRRLFHAGIQDEWAFAANWELTTGVRYDNYSDFDSAVSPRIALVWNTPSGLVTKLLYGRAFRAPSFGEMYTRNNPSILGNANLRPETIDTFELAFDYRPTKAVKFGLNLFEYRINDLIDYLADPSPATSRTAQNARDQKGRGFEIESEWIASDKLKFNANFSYQRSTDTITGAVVPDTPAMKLYANADWKFLSEWSANAQYIRIMDRHRPNGDTRPKIKDYDLINLTISKKNIIKNMNFTASVRNLFDSNGREPGPAAIPNDYPIEHRSFRAELRYNF